MARKNITIDTQAYRRLKKQKKDGESFSKVIKRLVPKPLDFQKWMQSVGVNPPSEKAAETVERVVARRRVGRNRTY